MFLRRAESGFGLRLAAQAVVLGILMAMTPTSFGGSCDHGATCGCFTGSCGVTGSCGILGGGFGGGCGFCGACGDAGSCTAGCIPDYLGSAPRMLGDFLSGSGSQLRIGPVLDPVVTPLPVIDMTVGGGPSRVKIGDNNKALPKDRWYSNFNYFKNVVHVQPGAEIGAAPRHWSFNRYTIGVEKAFLCDQHSIEVRVPFTQRYAFDVTEFGVRADGVDNLTLIYKYLVDIGGMDDTGSMVAGIGINIPTGDDTEGTVRATTYEIQNEAVNLMPYVGFLGAEDATFFHMFLQFDFLASGNPIVVRPAGDDGLRRLGTYTDQHLIHIDLSLGRWLFPDCCPPPLFGFSGVAGIVELHYTSTLRSTDEVTGIVDGRLLEFRNFANRVDILNMTAGLHFEFGSRTSIRLAGGLPLRRLPNRSYDAQALAQVNFHF